MIMWLRLSKNDTSESGPRGTLFSLPPKGRSIFHDLLKASPPPEIWRICPAPEPERT